MTMTVKREPESDRVMNFGKVYSLDPDANVLTSPTPGIIYTVKPIDEAEEVIVTVKEPAPIVKPKLRKRKPAL